MIANPKLIDGQFKTTRTPGGIFLYQPQRKLKFSEDPRDVLTRLVLGDGCVKAVGEICEKNPQTAQWLIRKIAQVEELRVRDGKPPGRFDVYDAVARQAIARVACKALLDDIRGGK